MKSVCAVEIHDGELRDRYRAIQLHLATHPRCDTCGAPAAVVQRDTTSTRALCRRCSRTSAPRVGATTDDDRRRRLQVARATQRPMEGRA